MLILLLIILLLVLLFGGLGAFVAEVFLWGLLIALVIALVAGFRGVRRV